jgi:pyrroloquinoline quinone (PQQ) biosynthesis protein C
MSFSEEYHRTHALEAALEWMLWRLVSTAQNPQSVLNDFNQHMLDREEQLREVAQKQLLSERVDVYSNMLDAASSLNEVRESMVASIKIGS